MLPDDVLLELFHFHVDKAWNEDGYEEEMEAWQSLVHVCRRWRSVVFVKTHCLFGSSGALFLTRTQGLKAEPKDKVG